MHPLADAHFARSVACESPFPAKQKVQHVFPEPHLA